MSELPPFSIKSWLLEDGWENSKESDVFLQMDATVFTTAVQATRRVGKL